MNEMSGVPHEQHEPSYGDNGGGGGNQRRWRGRRRRRRGGRGGGGGGGGGGLGGGPGGGGGGLGGGGGSPIGGADFLGEIDGPTESVCGVMEMNKDGSGWLRRSDNDYLPDDNPNADVYVPPGIVRQNRIQEGSEVRGQAGLPRPGAIRAVLASIDTIDGLAPEQSRERRMFKNLTVVDPTPQFVLEPGDGDISLRIIDLLCPIGKGQRGLVVAPPRSGKTVLLQKMCHAISERYPEVYMIVLLIDERPEEATAWKRAVAGERREVLVSTLDEGPKHHIRVSEMALLRAQRLVEAGKDVVILLDSITRLTRAYNAHLGGRGGATMSGGIGSKVLEVPKKFFGAARKCEEGGSLTILATTLVDTGSRMDQVIFEEFKGTGNSELVLNRQLAERRVFPAIDIGMSGTRKEELLLPPGVVQRLYTLRRVLARMNSLDAMPLLIDRLGKTKSNADFLNSFRVDE